jgi:DNA repair protein RadD
MTIKLRHYQEKAIGAAVKHLKHEGAAPGILVLPTGSGKSLVVANTARETSGRTLVFQPNKEILEQNYSKLIGYGFPESQVGILSASAGERTIRHVTYTTIGTAISHIEDLRSFKNIIIDECHLVSPGQGQYKELLEGINAQRIIGLSATPYRMKAYNAYGNETQPYSKINLLPRERPSYFSDIIHVTQIQELYAENYLCPLVYRRNTHFDPLALTLNTTGSDFDEDSMREYLSSRNYDIVAKAHDSALWALSLGRKSIIIFLPFVEEAALCAEQLCKANVNAVMLSGKTPKKERKKLLEAFKSQDDSVQVICNVGVLTTGFDFPALDCLILGRPTLSLALYYQMIGRAMRPHPSKANALIIDLAGTLIRFGKIENLQLVNSPQYKGWAVTNNGRQLTGVPIRRFSLQ